MDEELVERLTRMLDRQEILDCLHHYTRGVDRLDEEILVSAFHEDGIDHHGPVDGTVRDFMAHFWPSQPGRATCQHYLSNPTIVIEGNTARAETYFLSVNRQQDKSEVKLVGGRYADILERRDGEWRIADRVVISEWSLDGDATEIRGQRSRRDRTDPSYRTEPYTADAS